MTSDNRDTVQRVELAKGKTETIVDLVSLGASVLFMYFLYNPDVFDKIKGLAQGIWEKVKFQSAVWETRESINSLPITDITDNTPHNGDNNAPSA